MGASVSTWASQQWQGKESALAHVVMFLPRGSDTNSAEHFYLYRRSFVLVPPVVLGGEISDTRTNPRKTENVEVGSKDTRRTESLLFYHQSSVPFAAGGKQNDSLQDLSCCGKARARQNLSHCGTWKKTFELSWASSAEPMKSQALCSLRDKSDTSDTQWLKLCSQWEILRILKAGVMFSEAFLITEGSNLGQRKQEREDTSSKSRIRLASPVESQGHNWGFSFSEQNAGIEMLSCGFSLPGKLGCPAGNNPGWSRITP